MIQLDEVITDHISYKLPQKKSQLNKQMIILIKARNSLILQSL